MAICMLIGWLRRPTQRRAPGIVELPPDMQKHRPTLQELAKNPRLLAQSVFAWAVIGILAFLFLPIAIGILLSDRSAGRSGNGGTAAT
jgi:hypothetical protein